MAPKLGSSWRPLEQEEHRTLAGWLDMHRLVWLHVPMGGQRRYVEAAIFHGLGARAGIPDILILSPPPAKPEARGVAIELKRQGRQTEARGGVTDEQRWWMDRIERCGWLVRVCYGAMEAIAWLESLGYGRGRVMA